MPTLEEIYFKNIYEVVLSSDQLLLFSLENFSNNHFFDRSFAIVTASNPLNVSLPSNDNERRNALLYSELNSKNVLAARGCYENHCEDGYLIFDITLSDALLLGQKYEQVAVFYNDSKRLMYVDCKNAKVMVERSR